MKKSKLFKFLMYVIVGVLSVLWLLFICSSLITYNATKNKWKDAYYISTRNLGRFYFIKKNKFKNMEEVNTKLPITWDKNIDIAFSDQGNISQENIEYITIIDRHEFETVIDPLYWDSLESWLRVYVDNTQQSLLKIRYYNPEYSNIFTPTPYIEYWETWLSPSYYITNDTNCFYLVKHNDIIWSLINNEGNCQIVPIPEKAGYPYLVLRWHAFLLDEKSPISLEFKTIE